MPEHDWADYAERVATELTEASDPSWSFEERRAAEVVLASALQTVYEMGREDAVGPVPPEPSPRRLCDHACLTCGFDALARGLADAAERMRAAEEPAETTAPPPNPPAQESDDADLS